MYWSVIETNIGILAVSIPSFKSIFKRFLPRFLGDSSSQKRTLGTENKYGNGTETSRSGFVELSERGGNTDDVVMDNIYGNKNTIDTNIAYGKEGTTMYNTTASSSEEMIFPPKGKILAQTQISTTVSGSAGQGA